jgi:chromosome segregation ATPase
MNDVDKILQAIAGLQEGQKSLQAAIDQQGKATKTLQETIDRQRKLLTGLTGTTGTILEEQQAQRIDIRSLHDELHASKEELKSEILSSRAEAKRNTIDLQATVGQKLKRHEQRIDELEDEAGIPHPDEN